MNLTSIISVLLRRSKKDIFNSYFSVITSLKSDGKRIKFILYVPPI